MPAELPARSATVVADGLGAVESVRVHDGVVWFADWTAGAVCRMDDDGRVGRIVEVGSAPIAFDWRPDGTMVLRLGAEGRVELLDGQARRVGVVDLTGISEHPWNDMAVAPDGTAYLGDLGYDFLGNGAFAPEGRRARRRRFAAGRRRGPVVPERHRCWRRRS